MFQTPFIFVSPEIDLLYFSVVINLIMYLVVYPFFVKKDFKTIALWDGIVSPITLLVVIFNYWDSGILILIFEKEIAWWIYFIGLYFLLDTIFFIIYTWQYNMNRASD